MDEYERLLLQVERGNEQQVITAAHALGDLGDSRAVPVLIQLLESTESGAIRNAAAVGLHELGDSAAVPALLEQIKDPQHVNARGTLVYALEGLDIRPVLTDVCELVYEGNYEVAAMATSAIEAMPGPISLITRRDAEAVLRKHLMEAKDGSWRKEMIEQSLEMIESLTAIES